MLESLFPELAESENERTRKELIDTINLFAISKENRDKYISWLEKQGGKQKPQRQIAAEAKEAMYYSPTDKDIKEQILTEYEKVKADTIAEKQAVWGDEDEEMKDSLVHFLQLYGDLQFSKPVKQSMIDWLKSIRSNNKWKPTKAQMDVLLGEVIVWKKGCPKQIVFESLYNDLKKLMDA